MQPDLMPGRYRRDRRRESDEEVVLLELWGGSDPGHRPRRRPQVPADSGPGPGPRAVDVADVSAGLRIARDDRPQCANRDVLLLQGTSMASPHVAAVVAF